MRVKCRLPITGCRLLIAIGLLACATGVSAQTVTLEAKLIHASDRPAALDTRLDAIEFRLRRIFQFEHYGFLNETRTLITLPSQTRVDIGNGYTLDVKASSRDGRIRAEIQWYRGSQRMMSTSVSQKRGVPAILGGPPHDGGTLILVLEFK